MHRAGTYGGHVELAAFAQLSLKQTKILQPNLDLVVTGTQADPLLERARNEKKAERAETWAQAEADETILAYPNTAATCTRRLRKFRRPGQAEDAVPMPLETVGTLYVVFHASWEHYSAVRQLGGPRRGLPRIRELPAVPNASLPSVSTSPSAHATTAPSTSGSPDAQEDATQPTELETHVLAHPQHPHSVQEVRAMLLEDDTLTVVALLRALDDQSPQATAFPPPGWSSVQGEDHTGSGVASTPATEAYYTDSGLPRSRETKRRLSAKPD